MMKKVAGYSVRIHPHGGAHRCTVRLSDGEQLHPNYPLEQLAPLLAVLMHPNAAYDTETGEFCAER